MALDVVRSGRVMTKLNETVGRTRWKKVTIGRAIPTDWKQLAERIAGFSFLLESLLLLPFSY